MPEALWDSCRRKLLVYVMVGLAMRDSSLLTLG